MKIITIFIFTGLLFSIAGCSASKSVKHKIAFELVVGRTSNDEITIFFGSPDHVKKNRSGSGKVWMYSGIARIIYKETQKNNKPAIDFWVMNQQRYFDTKTPGFDLMIYFNNKGIVTNYSILPIQVSIPQWPRN